MERIRLDQSALQAVDEYCEYTRVQEEGGPRAHTEPSLCELWGPRGLDCKLIGPETPCFCTHRYKQHQTEFEQLPSQRPLMLPCCTLGCLCSQYQYVPHFGSRPVRCRCKHLPEEHRASAGHVCTRCSCGGFSSPAVCGCGQPYSAHRTLVETREERQARGAPLGRDVPYAAMGGLTGFSSLMDGYLRLDSSEPGPSSTSGTVQRTTHTKQ
ncbi:hypothetical protein WMY93_019593 [Mugilogobius chulae]|uniref:Protein FAM221A n=1 Tax=Mugilogobius chulae TaxID=88201 RepID=A0AAW0NEN7_9GOBI